MCTLLIQTFCLVCDMQALALNNNQIGDTGMIKFSEALATGALANVTTLNLAANQITDKGTEAFSAALATGAMAHLNDLYLSSNPISDESKGTMRSAMSKRSGQVHL